MGITVEELEIIVRANVKEAMVSLEQVKAKIEETFAKNAVPIADTMAKVRLDTQKMATQSVSAYEKINSKIKEQELLLQNLAIQRKNAEDSIRNSIPKGLSDTAKKQIEPQIQSMVKENPSILKIETEIQRVNALMAELKTKTENEVAPAMTKVANEAKKIATPIEQSIKKTVPQVKRLGTEMQKTAKQGVTAFTTLGAVIARAFKFLVIYKALRELFAFIGNGIKNAINAPEIENMFRVAFGNASDEAAKFAESMKKAYGISIVSSKEMLGTFQNMITSMGISSKNSTNMSKGLTKLAHDMASLYNVDPQQASENLQSAIGGQGRAVRKYGYVITESTIKETAYRLGIAKTGVELTEQQKVTARYMTIMEQSKNAQGDLGRTINQVANQLRILKDNITDAGRSIGEAFIPFIQAVLPPLNTFMVMLQRIGAEISKFTFALFGIDYTQWKKDQESIISGTGDMSQADDEFANSANKAAKAQKGLLSGFDKLNISQSKADGTGGVSGGEDFLIPDVKDPEGTSPFDKMADRLIANLKKIKDTINEYVANPLLKGFKEGFASANFDKLKQSIIGIGRELKNIFTSPEVSKGFGNLVSTISLNLGKVVGSFASIGVSLATGLLGGFKKFLEKNKTSIQKSLVSFFDITSKTYNITGKFAEVMADIATVFTKENAQEMISNFIGIFSEIAFGVLEIGARIGRDFMDLISAPIIKNKEKIKVALDGMLEVMSEHLETIKELIKYTFEKIIELYDKHIKPFIDTVKDAFSEWFKHWLDGWNTHIKPVLDEFAAKLREVVEEHVKPMIDKAMEFFGKLFDELKEYWDKFLKPFVSWFIDEMAPKISKAFEIVGSVFNIFLTVVSDVIGSIFEVLGGLIDFVVGVFTSDWKKAWKGVKSIFSGIWDGIVSIAKGAIELITDLIKSISFEMPDFTPKYTGGRKNVEYGVPKLAKGGVLTSPRIVMAGEYAGARNNPEIVTPQSLMYETSFKAQQAANQPLVAIMSQVLQAIKEGHVLEMNSYEVGRIIRSENNNNNLLLGL